ncbi:GNAT family N-acetyltransferase [Priestia taiwanensis]|uniref:N-acetyltransferase n=1 Tax=Priestia taiwanensis TaxID=1347902 RepID=A0A917EPT0_9BACI|nr:GNAT family N-acetyltransferase [Priestia taiwanensis]MBM7362620.1 GNAT superfamily N-acetyltransferase [Priestia taiwanensis]GGE63727.1 N-acetyltransferase [Priestia taiwanensis]
MGEILIRRPLVTDIGELHGFFRTVIEDTFAKNGLADLVHDIEGEIEGKKKCLKSDFDSKGEERYFLLGIDSESNKIIGSIEYGPAREIVVKETNGELKDVVEVGTVFVLPDYQKNGIGTLMWNEVLRTLSNRGIHEFCLDSGYTTAQKIWGRKFGMPDYLLKDYWGEGHDHMIWRRTIKSMD